MALPEISSPRGTVRSQAWAHLEQINPYDGQNGVSVGTVKVIKRLLCDTEGDTQWIGYRNFANSIVHRPLEALYPGDRYSISYVIVEAQTFTSGPCAIRMYRPMGGQWAPIHTVAGPYGLGNCKIRVL